MLGMAAQRPLCASLRRYGGAETALRLAPSVWRRRDCLDLMADSVPLSPYLTLSVTLTISFSLSLSLSLYLSVCLCLSVYLYLCLSLSVCLCLSCCL